jgi:hypothetical protein
MTARKRQYFELVEHNIVQFVLFFVIIVITSIFVFSFLMPFIQNAIIEEFLQGKVLNTGEVTQFIKDTPNLKQKTNYYFSWAIDIYIGTPQESRFWFNPTLSFFIPILLIAILVAIIITSNIPVSIGLLRVKIEREIIRTLDLMHLKIFGFHSVDQNKELTESLLKADIRDLHDYVEKWGVPYEDLKMLKRVLKWKHGNIGYKMLHFFTGMEFYLKFYFTTKYSNLVLGLVYMGAAVLIIIIGMRGLKFIPSTQPSIVFFALGLEFSVLLTYAFTVMFSRNDSDEEQERVIHGQKENMFLSSDFGNSQEVENLLRVFIKTPKDKSRN